MVSILYMGVAIYTHCHLTHYKSEGVYRFRPVTFLSENLQKFCLCNGNDLWIPPHNFASLKRLPLFEISESLERRERNKEIQPFFEALQEID